MKKTILSLFALAATMFATTAEAQQKIYLNKGSKTVETVELGADDYIAFGRPEGVKDQLLADITNVKTGKNYVKYSVVTKTSDQPYYQMCVSEAYLKLFVLQYFGGDLATMSEEDLNNVFSTIMTSGSYGYGAIGGADFTMTDGEKPENGSTQFIAAGENYYIVVCNLVQDGDSYALGSQMTHTIVRTADPGESSATLNVSYAGMDESGKALFDVEPGNGINSLHLVLGSTKSIDEFVSLYGYASLMYTQGVNFSAEQWAKFGSEYRGWNITKENDYSFFALGVDENGNWVKAAVENIHIKPLVSDDCPDVNVLNSQSANGEMAIQYSIKTKGTLQNARLLIMKERNWDDALNNLVRDNGYENPSEGWAEYMSTAEEAVDVTEAVKSMGETFTFRRTFTDDERGWYVIVLAVTDENGTSVTRSSFHTHLADAQWDTLTKTFPKK